VTALSSLTLHTRPPRSKRYIHAGSVRQRRVYNSYIEYHEARASILDQKQVECVQVKREVETACEELMEQVVQHLCIKYPDQFGTELTKRRACVRNELVNKEYSIVRPFECYPLEISARLAMEDFNIFVEDEFSLHWYL
jgi:hypothetical protein